MRKADRPLAAGWAPLRHPYLLLLVICLTLHLLFDLSDPDLCAGVSQGVLLALILEILGGYLLCLKWQRRLTLERFLPAGILTLAGLVMGILLPYTGGSMVILAGLIALMAAGICLALLCRLNTRQWALLILAAGFILRLGYVLYSDIVSRQHDVGVFGGDSGHAYYIQYLYTHLALPDFDPRQVFQLYQPPLHYLCAALWMRLGTLAGMSFHRVCENLQFLSLFYSSCAMVLGYRIFQHLRLRGKALLAATALFALHPTFLIFAGFINNDPLSSTLTFAAILAALRWYRRPTVKHILTIALTLGLAMMTKLSSGIVAPAIAFLFAWKWLVHRRRETPQMLGQFALFALVCFPLALWWSVRNFVRFGVPLGYVPMLSNTSWQYLGDGYTPAQRLFEVRRPSLDQIFVLWGSRDGTPYCEYNLLLALFKTAIFGEFYLFPVREDAYWYEAALAQNRAEAFFSRGLFWSQAVLRLVILAAAAALLLRLLRRRGHGKVQDAFFLFLAAVVLLFYIRFCFQFPHTCSQNMRYTTPLLLCGAVFLGRWTQMLEARPGRFRRALAWAPVAASGVFCVFTAGVYVLLGLAYTG